MDVTGEMTQKQRHGPMAETLDFAFGDWKTDHRKCSLFIYDKENKGQNL